MIPVNVLTGFLGSGKTTLLQRLLRSPQLARTAVLINEFGEIGLDHLLVERTDEAVVLLQSGCICCSIRGDLKTALRDLLGRRDRGEITLFDRIVIETTGIADPTPILYTLQRESVLQHHFELANVVTTVDGVNAALHLSENPESLQQVAAADWLVITKTDLAGPQESAQLRAELSRLNPSAGLVDGYNDAIEPDVLLAPRRHDLSRGDAAGRGEARAYRGVGMDAPAHGGVASLSLALEAPLDWTAFGIWLSLLLHRHGRNVLRVKGILQVLGSPAPIFINAVQHVVHPPLHLTQWPTADRRSRLVFITRQIDHALLKRSLAAFCRNDISESVTDPAH